MADISVIKLPDGSEYEIKDEVARSQNLIAIYTAATQNLALDINSSNSTDDDEEF